MKLESEPVFCHSTLGPNPISETSSVATVTQLSMAELFEKDSEFYAGRSVMDCHAPELTSSIAPVTQSSRGELFEKDSEFYIGRSVMECHMPELIVCYKENSCNVVKDICVDEGMPSHDKILFETDVDEKTVYTILPPKKDYEESVEELEFTDISIQDDLKLSVEFDSDNDFDPKDLSQTGEVEYDVTEFDNNDDPKLELGAESSASELLNINFNGVEQQSIQVTRDLENSEIPAKVENGIEEKISEYSAPVSEAEEPKEDGVLNDLSYNSKVENGSITFDFGSLPPMECHESSDMSSLAPAASGREDMEENSASNSLAPTASSRTESHQSVDSAKTENNSTMADGISLTYSVPSQVQRDAGESSFSIVAPLASLINYSGPVAYSGSLSLRSDSSTTSTRSFAFPILQAEWNSSPVRMAKADRRFFRKHRGWRQGLFCCRF